MKLKIGDKVKPIENWPELDVSTKMVGIVTVFPLKIKDSVAVKFKKINRSFIFAKCELRKVGK